MADENKYNLSITRILESPLEHVWRAWTDPSELQKWWGPRGVTNPTCVWEAQASGKINIIMLAGEELGALKGQEWPMVGQFEEVIPYQKLVYTASAIMNGKPIIEHQCIVMFEEQGDNTKMNLSVTVSKTTPEAAGPLAGMKTGWNQSLDKLSELLN
jgi:uncharacterized protein YndB with AHSA1/START domain